MSDQDDYTSAIDNLVEGALPLGTGPKVLAIGMAMKEHSRHRPRTVVEDVDGDGGFDYALSDLASWSDDFSVVSKVEYPVDDDDQDGNRLQDDAWEIYRKPAGDFLRFLENTPDTDEDFRVTYTALHTCTASACTVPSIDEEAVQALAAAYFCDMLAAHHAQNGDSGVDADSVDHGSRRREYAAQAKTYRRIYFVHLGVEEGKTPAASVTRDQDVTPSWRGARLTHPRKYR